MNVLLVDDQINVLSSIKSGVSWTDLGILDIYTATNAANAKKIIQSHKISIMLTDIEMPGESGLSLLRWCRREGYTFECIFLTSHADFFYAQEALQLGSFDYLLQPARYEDIERVIRNAIQRLEETEQHQKYFAYGKAAFLQKDSFLKALLLDYMSGYETSLSSLLDTLHTVGIPIQAQSNLYLLWITLISWNRIPMNIHEWQEGFVQNLNQNFSSVGMRLFTYSPEQQSLLAVLYQEDESFLPYKQYQDLLRVVYAQITHTFSCHIAFYSSDAITMEHFSDEVKLLESKKSDNVIQSPGIYLASPAAASGETFYITAEFNQLLELRMKSGQPDRAAKEALSFLAELASGGKLNKNTLIAFGRDYQLAAMSAAKGLHIPTHNLPAFSDYIKVHCQMSQMESYLNAVTIFFQENSHQKNERTYIEEIDLFIQNNIDKPLQCADIAKEIFLSPDYITKIMQKEKGVSLKEYITHQKINTARQLLLTTSLPVSIIAARVGYENFSHFSKVYKKVTGITPSEERNSR